MLLFLLAAVPAWPQAQKDPLTDIEAEQIREYADRPPDRLKLYMKFIEQRTSAIRQISADGKDRSHGAKLHSLIEEFTRLADELQDNLDVYSKTHDDVRKVLKEVIEASSKWPTILKQPPPDNAYDFSRKTALDAAASASDEARKMLAEQDRYFAELKAKNKKDAVKPE